MRRDVLRGVSAAGGALIVAHAHGAHAAGATPAVSAPRPPAPVTPASTTAAPEVEPEVRALFGAELAPGARVGRWRVVAVQGRALGGIVVVLATAQGARFQLDVLRRDPAPGAPQGVAQTRALSVFVRNRGDGWTATDEEQGLGAMALAAALAAREAAGAPVPALLTLGERVARYPSGAFRARG